MTKPNLKLQEKSRESSDKSLQSWLWDAACSIRGAQDAPKYKDFILPLVFTKRLCDVFDDEIDRIAEKVGSRAKAFNLVARDQNLVRFYLPLRPENPENPVWSVIRRLSDRIGEQLTTHLRDIARANPLLQGIIDRIDFNATTHGQRDIADDRLSNLIERISVKRLGLEDVEPDIIGRSYEYLIRKFAEGSGQSAGEFYTPKEVGIVMARIMNPEPGMSVYDPCCGSAGLLIKCQLFLKEKMAQDGDGRFAPLQLFGQEYIGNTWAMANMNMIIHDMEGRIEIGDTFRNPKFREEGRLRTFDRVVANPMWNQGWFTEADYDADELGRFSFGVPPASTADWGWVQHMHASLSANGKLAVVLDTNAVSRGSGSKNKSRERDIRQQFVEKGLIETVILLPENLFYNTGAPGIILVLDKSRATDAPIRLINASQLFDKGKPKNFLTTDHIERIVAASTSDVDIEGLCRVITPDVAEQLDYDLSPARHVPLDPDIPVVTVKKAVQLLQPAQEQASEVAAARLSQLRSLIEVENDGSELPQGWVRRPIADLIAKKVTGAWGEGEPQGAGYVRCTVIRGTDFPDASRAHLAGAPTRFIKEAKFKKKRPLVGDIIVETSGGGKYQNTGRVLFVSQGLLDASDEHVMFTNFTKLLRPRDKMICPKYLYYTWAMLYDLGRTARYEKQPTNIKNFKLDDFLQHEIIIYPEDMEQQLAIVAALDAVHEELDALAHLERLVESLRRATMHEFLTAMWVPKAHESEGNR